MYYVSQSRRAIEHIAKTCRAGGDSILDEAGELFFVSVLILLHQVAHVLGNVDAHNVLAMDLCVEFFTLWVISREALGAGGGNKKVVISSQFNETLA